MPYYVHYGGLPLSGDSRKSWISPQRLLRRSTKNGHFSIWALGWEMAQKEYHERVFQVSGIRKNVQPIEKRPSRSFSAPTLRRRPAKKVVPPQTGLKVAYFYTVSETYSHFFHLRYKSTPLRDRFGVGPLFWRRAGAK